MVGGATGQQRAARGPTGVAGGGGAAAVSHLVARLEHRLRRGVLPKRRLVEQQRAPHRQRRAQTLDERGELEREVQPGEQRREQPALRANGDGGAALGVARGARRRGDWGGAGRRRRMACHLDGSEQPLVPQRHRQQRAVAEAGALEEREDAAEAAEGGGGAHEREHDLEEHRPVAHL